MENEATLLTDGHDSELCFSNFHEHMNHQGILLKYNFGCSGSDMGLRFSKIQEEK